MIIFTVPGKVRGKGRPRAVRRGGYVSMYTDAKTASSEQQIGLYAKAVMQGKDMLTGPVAMFVTATIAVPVSWSKAKRNDALSGVIHPTGKPDADNVLKLVCDALNGICWVDDAQVVVATIQKQYGKEDGLSVEINSLGAIK